MNCSVIKPIAFLSNTRKLMLRQISPVPVSAVSRHYSVLSAKAQIEATPPLVHRGSVDIKYELRGIAPFMA